METTMQGHKLHLQEQVSERRTELVESLLDLRSEPQSAHAERVNAVELALVALETHSLGGWDLLDGSESAALTTWLESSRLLCEAPTRLAG